jgi:hypothetical protein
MFQVHAVNDPGDVDVLLLQTMATKLKTKTKPKIENMNPLEFHTEKNVTSKVTTRYDEKDYTTRYDDQH